MEIVSVFDPSFREYGRVVTGLEDAVKELQAELRKVPVPVGTEYVAEYAPLQNLPAYRQVSLHLFGGIPVQLGWCSGHNTRLNCLEYHRSSEFNLGTEEFILLVAKQQEVQDGMLDTSKVRAFRAPAGVLVEVYATTLHYAPCSGDIQKGFCVLVALPRGTNGDKLRMECKTPEDFYMIACNKWLLAHPQSPEAEAGAKTGLKGENIDISDDIKKRR